MRCVNPAAGWDAPHTCAFYPSGASGTGKALVMQVDSCAYRQLVTDDSWTVTTTDAYRRRNNNNNIRSDHTTWQENTVHGNACFKGGVVAFWHNNSASSFSNDPSGWFIKISGYPTNSDGWSAGTAPCDPDEYARGLQEGEGFFSDPGMDGGWCKTIPQGSIAAVRTQQSSGAWVADDCWNRCGQATYLPRLIEDWECPDGCTKNENPDQNNFACYQTNSANQNERCQTANTIDHYCGNTAYCQFEGATNCRWTNANADSGRYCEEGAATSTSYDDTNYADHATQRRRYQTAPLSVTTILNSR